MKHVSWVAIMVAVACGGGGGGSGGTGEISDAQARAACAKICEHDIECGNEQTQEECVTECLAEVANVPFRADVINDIADCNAELACDASDDVCLSQCTPTATHEEYETKCRAKVAECGGEPTDADGPCEATPSDAEESFLCLLRPAIVNELSDCMELSCEEVDACLDGILDQYDL